MGAVVCGYNFKKFGYLKWGEISIGNSMICSDIWHKYHEWYFKIVLHNFTSRRWVKFGTILKYHEWYLCQISHTNHAIICLYYNLRNFCNLTPSLYFRRVVSLRRRANCFRSSCFRPSLSRHWARSMYFFLVFRFSEFSFSSWISWFQNLEIFPPFFRNSCDEIMWWFGVTIVTVIFTCRYFKLSWNTSALSQSNCRNFSGSSIRPTTTWEISAIWLAESRCISA